MELTLISKIKEIQEREGLTDVEMARRLGCSRQLYQGTRSGKIPLGRKILNGIMTGFPELKKDVIYFLTNDANKSPKDANKNPPKQPSEAQKRGWKRFFGELIEKIKSLSKFKR